MAQPSPNDGQRQMALVQVEAAARLLERALPQLGSTSPEGASVLKALQAMAKLVGSQQNQELVPAQLMELARAQGQSPMEGMMGGKPQAAPQMPPSQQPQQL